MAGFDTIRSSGRRGVPMKRLLVVALLVLPFPALAWFGPSDASECRSRYAKAAPDQRAVQVASSNCTIAFDESRHPVERRRALCVAEGVSKLNSGAASGIVSDECKVKHPDPACPTNQAFDFQRKLCVCAPGFVLNDARDGCRENFFNQFDAR